MKTYYVYILANEKNGTLYIGVTGNLMKRLHAHKTEQFDGFTKKYNIKRLVWFNETNSVEDALNYEKRLKRWKRKWKITLINQTNPYWRDLFYAYSKEWIPAQGRDDNRRKTDKK